MTNEATPDEAEPKQASSPTEAGARAVAARKHRSQELGRKVLHMIQDRGWRPAEFARRAGIRKDVVSTTINGKNYPSYTNLRAMAQALGVPMNELSVAYEEPVLRHANVGMGAHALPGQPGRMRLTVDMVVPSNVAIEVLNILQASDAGAADRS